MGSLALRTCTSQAFQGVGSQALGSSIGLSRVVGSVQLVDCGAWFKNCGRCRTRVLPVFLVLYNMGMV